MFAEKIGNILIGFSFGSWVLSVIGVFANSKGSVLVVMIMVLFGLNFCRNGCIILTRATKIVSQ